MSEPDFSKTDGLIPAIAQDHQSGKILMLAYINEDSWNMTLKTGEAHYWSRSRQELWHKGGTSGHVQKAHYWSRSRQELWHKGGTSGHVQKVREILIDCDGDTVVFKVEQIGGAACHEGYESCFFRRVDNNGVFQTIEEKIFDPEKVYKK